MTRIAVPLAMLAIGAAGVPTATHSTCADNGCTVHKQTAWRCQCNLYCYSHGDCCPDVTDACFNGTKPVDPDASPPHNGEASHTRARNTTEPIHASPKPHVARNGTAPVPVHAAPNPDAVAKVAGRDGPKEEPAHAGAGGPARSAVTKGGGAPVSRDAKDGGSAHGSHDDDRGAHDHEADKGSHGHDADKGSHEQEADKGSHGKANGNAEGAVKAGGAHSGSSAPHHEADGKKMKPSVGLLVAACFLALSLPIAISALLVARARGICCFNRFQKLNKDEAAGAPGALSTVKEEDGASDTPSRQGQP